MQYKLVNDIKSLDNFIETVKGLHDSILHELVMVHPGYVDNEGVMYGESDLPKAQIIFQSQYNEIPCIKLILNDIILFKYDPGFDLELEAEIKNSCIALYLSGKSNESNSIIIAKEIKYQIIDTEYRGKEYKLSKYTEDE